MSGVQRAQLPNLVLAGVTKAGTTSLHAYLAQHPEIFVPVAKELNHFSPAVHGRPLPDLASYARHFRSALDQPWRLDASPFYFVGGAPVAQLVRSTLDHPRVLVVLRDPVDRLWSSYNAKASKGVVGTAETFEEFFDQCVTHLRRDTDLLPESSTFLTLRTGRYAEFLPAWMDAFGEDLLVVFTEELAHDPAGVMARIFGWLGVDEGVAGALDYGRRNVTQGSRSVRLRRTAARANIGLKPVLSRLPGARRLLRLAYDRLNSAERSERLRPEVRQRVHDFYAGSVAELDELLVARGYAETPDWVTGGHRSPLDDHAAPA